MHAGSLDMPMSSSQHLCGYTLQIASANNGQAHETEGLRVVATWLERLATLILSLPL